MNRSWQYERKQPRNHVIAQASIVFFLGTKETNKQVRSEELGKKKPQKTDVQIMQQNHNMTNYQLIFFILALTF